MVEDEFADARAGLSTPGERHAAVTPGPGDLFPRPRALRIGGAGTVTVVDKAGVSVVYTVAAGEVMTFRAVKVTAATATDIVAWW